MIAVYNEEIHFLDLNLENFVGKPPFKGPSIASGLTRNMSIRSSLNLLVYVINHLSAMIYPM